MSTEHSVLSHWLTELSLKVLTAAVALYLVGSTVGCSREKGGGVIGNGAIGIQPGKSRTDPDFDPYNGSGNTLPSDSTDIGNSGQGGTKNPIIQPLAADALFYRNVLMGIAFRYPKDWHLDGGPHSDEVVLTNRNLVKDKKLVTEITFALNPKKDPILGTSLTSKLDGKKIFSDAKLKTALEKKGKDWKVVHMSRRGRSGYWREFYDEKEEIRTAEYYILDTDKNILRIRLRAQSTENGEAVVESIIAALTIDKEPPFIKKIYFSAKQVEAGGTVKLIVEADDELSGVALRTMGNVLPFVNQGSEFSYTVAPSKKEFEEHVRRFEDEQKEVEGDELAEDDAKKEAGVDLAPKNPEDLYKLDWEFLTSVEDRGLRDSISEVTRDTTIHGAFPMTGEFKRISTNIYEYELRIPPNSPPGMIWPSHLTFTDRKGNRLAIDADWFGEKEYVRAGAMKQDGLERKMPIAVEVPYFEVVAPEKNETYTPDYSPPKIVEVEWDKRLVHEEDSAQTLYVRIEDESQVRTAIKIQMGGAGTHYINMSAPTDPESWPGWHGHLPLLHLEPVQGEKNLYSVSLPDTYMGSYTYRNDQSFHGLFSETYLTSHYMNCKDVNPNLILVKELVIRDAIGREAVLADELDSYPVFEIAPNYKNWTGSAQRKFQHIINPNQE